MMNSVLEIRDSILNNRPEKVKSFQLSARILGCEKIIDHLKVCLHFSQGSPILVENHDFSNKCFSASVLLS